MRFGLLVVKLGRGWVEALFLGIRDPIYSSKPEHTHQSHVQLIFLPIFKNIGSFFRNHWTRPDGGLLAGTSLNINKYAHLHVGDASFASGLQ